MSVGNLPSIAVRGRSYLPPLPALRDFVNMYRLNAKKILSQNYLMDMNVIRKVMKTILIVIRNLNGIDIRSSRFTFVLSFL